MVYRHITLPQLQAAYTLPKCEDLLLIFHSIGEMLINTHFVITNPVSQDTNA
jgi:hypothetical protein